MKIAFEVVGYKKINNDLFYLSCLATEETHRTEGFQTFNGFVNSRYLHSLELTEENLLGHKGTYYTIKREDGKYKEVLSLSERSNNGKHDRNYFC